MVIQQTAVAEGPGAGARQVAHALHHHRDRARGQQGLAQVAGIEGDEARREVIQGIDWRRQARVVDDQAFEVSCQPRPAAQVVGDDRRQAQPEAAAMIVGQQAVAFDHHDVQAVMVVVEDRGIATVEQVIEHAL
ncbi:hypothetical protein D9M71_600050 [compost metagenome]